MTRVPRACTSALVAVAAALITPVAFAGKAHADAAVNLRLDDGVRADLLAAGAALKNMPITNFSGLEPGLTYYAFDPNTQTHWAGAHLVPSAKSYDAQVADQDSGSYTLFERPPGQGWTAVNDGYPRGIGGCPAPLPAAIMTLWEWNSAQCRPAPKG